ncbi:hypothetical protein BASA61_000142 [Batrachochytrium salamandrivorans]|nr:hypothetical protein BASA61_000142 [Batrachochytrium salamandrivorans]
MTPRKPNMVGCRPIPYVKKLRENIKTVTDEELQLGLTDAFVMIRDKHTRWTNMAPYGCFYATTGCDFYFKHPDLRPSLGRITPNQAGDELLAINGLSFVEWFKQNQFTSGAGANEFGGQRAALKYLTTIYGKINRLPSEDSITFQFKSRANPRTSILSMSRMSLDAMRTVGILEANCTRASLVNSSWNT